MKKPLLAVAVLALVLGSAQASESRDTDPAYNAGGFVTQTKSKELPVTGPVRQLRSVMPGRELHNVIRQAQDLVRDGSVQSMLILKHDKILFEGYNAPSGPQRPMFSYSMSKSLTAMTIGAMACRGEISSMDVPAETLAPKLAGTLWGRATVRQLLTMTSGVADGVGSGRRYRGEIKDLLRRKISATELLHQHGQEVKNQPGERWNYSNADTLALAVVAGPDGGMHRKFQRYIWDRAGVESPGYWAVDRDGVPIAAAGFGATTRDWARLALFSMDLMREGSDPCMKEFMHQATSSQVSISDRSFRGYGYQMWTEPRQGSGYWWQGHGGQRVAVDPERGLVMVITSSSMRHVGKTYHLWSELQDSVKQ